MAFPTLVQKAQKLFTSERNGLNERLICFTNQTSLYQAIMPTQVATSISLPKDSKPSHILHHHLIAKIKAQKADPDRS
ncbi:hypothetical protein [Scytonema sp. NUACC21]